MDSFSLPSIVTGKADLLTDWSSWWRSSTTRLVPGTRHFVSTNQNDLSILTNLLLLILLLFFLITANNQRKVELR